MALSSYFLLSFALIVASLSKTRAVEYSVSNTVPNTQGGAIFANRIGDAYARQTMMAATDFIWQVFQQATAADRKDVASVSLIIDNSGGVAATSGNSIYFSANYLSKTQGNKEEFTGVMYHEMTHVWQWNGKGNPSAGKVIEGIADFVRLKANLAPATWPRRGAGDSWGESSAVTAYFLDYCESQRNGFVAELNKKMRDGYSDDFFMQLLGRSVDRLFSEYKARYGGGAK
ncbi:hypothetical protein BT93_L2111 [Corymbia citriodora subsp. variegata]|uniref:Plant basic secretory protein (BSP) family protein n=1 Tax=Corymbia citriodora subsp. variegata TaxID=360336 RepID=A0A8T0CQ41_CORYI|nr:hypothetical protein BT93_L2111 [Corymbia citriodora subsp. variegata]